MSETWMITPIDKAEKVLEKGTFHKLMLLFHIPASWNSWQVALGALPLTAVTAAAWYLFTRESGLWVTAVFMLSLFFLTDAVLLRQLPARGLSYGPWQSQLFTLALPRTAVAIVISLVTAVGDSGWALLLLLVLQGVGTAAFVWGAFIEPFRLQLTQLTIQSERLPDEAPPIRILHITDLHIERLTGREARLLALVEEAQPDLILITGDYLNLSYVEDSEAHNHLRQLLNQLSAPYGVYGTLGSPPVDLRHVIPDLLADLPVRLLRNECVELDMGHGRRLALLGLDCTHHIPTDTAALDSVTAVVSPNIPTILLYHSPELMPQAAARGIDLYLCGHTHGGQVRLPWYGAILTSSQLGKRYEMGHYQHGRTHLYVSRGVGLEGLSAPRIRFLSPPEVTLVRLGGERAQRSRLVPSEAEGGAGEQG